MLSRFTLAWLESGQFWFHCFSYARQMEKKSCSWKHPSILFKTIFKEWSSCGAFVRKIPIVFIVETSQQTPRRLLTCPILINPNITKRSLSLEAHTPWDRHRVCASPTIPRPVLGDSRRTLPELTATTSSFKFVRCVNSHPALN